MDHHIKQICRLCLEPATLSNPSIEDNTVRDKMNTIFNFPFEINAMFPSQVCMECCTKMDAFYSFSNTVRSNQEQLTARESMLSYAEIKVEPDHIQHDVGSAQPDPMPVEQAEKLKLEIEFKEVDVEAGSEESGDDSRPQLQEEGDEKAKRLEEENRKIKGFYSLTCETCQESFLTLQELRRHARKIHNKPCIIKCCNLELSHKLKILEHINKHLETNPFRCELCDKTFARKSALQLHNLQKHNEDMPFKCNQCSQIFPKEYLLKSHERAHVQVECSLCQKVLSKAAIRKHMVNVHSDSNRHICETCGTKFRCRSALDRHVKNIHLGLVTVERTQCHICSRWVSNKYNLASHIKTVHDTEEAPVECDVCNQTYPNQKVLLKHRKRVHVEEKFECDICGRKFKREVYWKEHVASHTNQRLYTCNFCGMATNSSANLYSHKKSKHPNEWMEARKKTLEVASR